MDSEKKGNNIGTTGGKGTQASFDKKKAFSFLGFLASKAGRIVLTVVIAVILLIVFSVLLKTGNDIVFAICFLAFAIFGWKSLNKITPDLFLWMPLASWLIFYLVKGLLSAIIGVFVAPFWIGKKVSTYVMNQVDDVIQTVIE